MKTIKDYKKEFLNLTSNKKNEKKISNHITCNYSYIM